MYSIAVDINLFILAFLTQKSVDVDATIIPSGKWRE